MAGSQTRIIGYLLATSIGAFIGGCIVLLTSKVIPRIMSQLMSEMMGNMIAQMGGDACDPADL